MEELEQELVTQGFKEPKARRIGKSYLVCAQLPKSQEQSLLKEGHINLWYFRHRVEPHFGDAITQRLHNVCSAITQLYKRQMLS